MVGRWRRLRRSSPGRCLEPSRRAGRTTRSNDHRTISDELGGCEAESTELLLDALRAQFVVEEGRAQSLNARGVGLAGFGSVILSLLTLAVSSEVRSSGAAGLPIVAKGFLVAALWLLVVAVGIIVLGVMRPRLPKDFSGIELLQLQGRDPSTVRNYLVLRMKQAVERHRTINNAKARSLTWASGCVSLAVLTSAVAGTAIALS